ncbi:MAG: nitroreductase family protein [Candidatus Omnitrophica bacterium]|nr:nitroreductase family protein [Candidatus Omnitrophota bacterium]MBD3268831.1 nitroreductase family protein [Candidatus Omnitrophota bacterium]
MEFSEVVKKRCSVRNYSDRSIPDEHLEKIVDAARLSPTARGEEPWEFVVVTEKKALHDLGEITDHGKFLKGARAGIIVLCKDTKYYLEDGSAATENILLAATDFGIGSCWIAGDKKAYAEEICKYINAPAGFKLVSIVSLGHPKSDSRPHSKRALSEVMHKEKFQD